MKLLALSLQTFLVLLWSLAEDLMKIGFFGYSALRIRGSGVMFRPMESWGEELRLGNGLLVFEGLSGILWDKQGGSSANNVLVL